MKETKGLIVVEIPHRERPRATWYASREDFIKAVERKHTEDFADMADETSCFGGRWGAAKEVAGSDLHGLVIVESLEELEDLGRRQGHGFPAARFKASEAAERAGWFGAEWAGLHASGAMADDTPET